MIEFRDALTKCRQPKHEPNEKRHSDPIRGQNLGRSMAAKRMPKIVHTFLKAGSIKRMAAALGVAVLLGASIAPGQGASKPIKVGLWENTTTFSNAITLSPDQQARIAALPPDQQATVRSRMAGAPTTITSKLCIAGLTTMDSLLNQAQKRPGSKCTFTNRKQTWSKSSFDTTCTTEHGSMAGHSEFHMIDSDHMTGSSNMEGSMSGQNGGTMAMKMTSTVTSRYLGANCGDVKPFTPLPAE